MHRVEASTSVNRTDPGPRGRPSLGGSGRERWSRQPGVLGDAGTEGGRRHVLLYPRPQPVAGAALTDLPDLSIGTVMGQPAAAEPILIYVGLDSARTARERVDLALAEDGPHRGVHVADDLAMGTGYVNSSTAVLQMLELK